MEFFFCVCVFRREINFLAKNESRDPKRVEAAKENGGQVGEERVPL